MRQIVMVGFLQAQNCTQLASSWRHPDSYRDFDTPDYFRRIAQTLEQGKFHLAFFDDRLAMPEYGGDHRRIVEAGVRCVKYDAVTVMMVMGMATQRLGLGSTYSTTYYEPFHVARVFATADLMTNGRAAWNVVTSVNDKEAQNMGQDSHLGHDERYDRADEFMDIVLGHWNAWEDDAIVFDRKRNIFSDPDKVHRLDYKGKYLRSRGPFTVPRSPQGHPLVIQAGASGRGQEFAARWAETIFVAYPNLIEGRRRYARQKEMIAARGRDPEDVKICRLTFTVAAATKAEAEDKMAQIESDYRDIDGLSLLSEALNFDFARKEMDEPFTDAELASMNGMLAMRDRVMELAPTPNPTVRDFLRITQRGKPHDAMVGGPREIADEMEEWFTTRGCDGFVLAPTHVPGTYADFVRHVVPELQRRGLYHKDYKGTTLRENLGIKRPLAADYWRAAKAAE
jgi:FMN-dependent oxidoreductase (nitrilotriacetate monooxygenase family)